MARSDQSRGRDPGTDPRPDFVDSEDSFTGATTARLAPRRFVTGTVPQIMADDQGPGIRRETTNALAVLLAITGLSYVIILENAPPENVGLLLSLIAGAFTVSSVGVLLHVLEGREVFGLAGTYPVLVAAGVSIGTLWFSSTDPSSRQLTLVASGGIVVISVVGGLALRATH